jgi:ABC-type transporter Mla subunit MlaD
MKSKHLVGMIIFPVFLFLWGCFDSSLTIQVRYAEVLGLKQNDSIYFKESAIGKVQKVSYTQQGDYLVELNIAPDFKNAATVDSRFVIDNDSKSPQSKAVTIVQERPGGRVLTKGEIVQGSVRAGFLDDMLSSIKRTATAAQSGLVEAVQEMEKSLNLTSQKLDKEMAAALDELSRRLHTFSMEVRKLPEKREIQELEQSVKQFAEAFSKAHQNVRERIRQELLPQLREELDRLREQLRQEGRDKEIEEIDRQVKGMSAA